jgi:mRNA interferase MazF
VSDDYTPGEGDLVWLTFDPQAGHEQRGRRPALVLSPRLFNARSGLAIACPITSRAKPYPFNVTLPEGLAVSGTVLCDQIKSVDWRSRQAEFAGTAPTELLAEVRERLRPLLGY